MIYPELDRRDVVSKVMDLARQAGASDAEADISLDDGVTVTVRNGSLESVEYHSDCVVAMVLYFGRRKAGVSLTEFSDAALQAAVDKAKSIAKFTEEDPFCELAPEALMLKKSLDLDLYYPWAITPSEMIQLALEGDAKARAQAGIAQTEAVAVSSLQAYSASANSRGFLQQDFSAQHEMAVSLIAKSGDEMERDGYYTLARRAEDLMSMDRVAHLAAERAVKRLHPQKIKTCKAPVIFLNEVSRSIFSHFISAISGGNLYRGASFLCDHLGRQIFPSHIEIYEEPLLKGALGSASYDQDAVATYGKHFAKEGRLDSYALGHYAALKMGLKTTANAGGVFNLFVSHQDLSLEDLLRQMGRGFLVTELMGQGANLMTGDYSRGAAGFWVDQGRLQYPVSGVTIASTLPQMFKNIVAISGDRDPRSSYQCGSLLISEMTIAGD